MPVSDESISRFEFLRQLGFQGAALLAVTCLGQGLSSCKKSDITPAPLSGPVTVDLSANTVLGKVGGYVVTNNIVVANTSKGFVAVTVVCSHEGQRQVRLQSDEFYCPAHGARYGLDGKGLNANGSRGLTAYTVRQSGNILTIS